jgi:hypothetical protein
MKTFVRLSVVSGQIHLECLSTAASAFTNTTFSIPILPKHYSFLLSMGFNWINQFLISLTITDLLALTETKDFISSMTPADFSLPFMFSFGGYFVSGLFVNDTNTKIYADFRVYRRGFGVMSYSQAPSKNIF